MIGLLRCLANWYTYQYSSCCGLSGDELACPVLRLRNPSDLLGSIPFGILLFSVAVPLLLLPRIGRFGAEQPTDDSSEEHQKQTAEQGHDAGADERVPASVVEAAVFFGRRLRRKDRFRRRRGHGRPLRKRRRKDGRTGTRRLPF